MWRSRVTVRTLKVDRFALTAVHEVFYSSDSTTNTSVSFFFSSLLKLISLSLSLCVCSIYGHEHSCRSGSRHADEDRRRPTGQTWPPCRIFPETQRGRHGSADHAASPGDAEPWNPATSIPRGEPLHPVLLQARRERWSQDHGDLKAFPCLCPSGTKTSHFSPLSRLFCTNKSQRYDSHDVTGVLLWVCVCGHSVFFIYTHFWGSGGGWEGFCISTCSHSL